MLECREVSVSYGGLVAVKPTSLHVERGQLVGLIGPNGAGKTTLIDALTGFVRSAGAVVFDGQDLSGLRPHRRVQALSQREPRAQRAGQKLQDVG